MQRILFCLLAFMILFIVVGCDGEKDDDAKTENPPSEPKDRPLQEANREPSIAGRRPSSEAREGVELGYNMGGAPGGGSGRTYGGGSGANRDVLKLSVDNALSATQDGVKNSNIALEEKAAEEAKRKEKEAAKKKAIQDELHSQTKQVRGLDSIKETRTHETPEKVTKEPTGPKEKPDTPKGYDRRH